MTCGEGNREHQESQGLHTVNCSNTRKGSGNGECTALERRSKTRPKYMPVMCKLCCCWLLGVKLEKQRTVWKVTERRRSVFHRDLVCEKKIGREGTWLTDLRTKQQNQTQPKICSNSLTRGIKKTSNYQESHQCKNTYSTV